MYRTTNVIFFCNICSIQHPNYLKVMLYKIVLVILKKSKKDYFFSFLGVLIWEYVKMFLEIYDVEMFLEITVKKDQTGL